MINKSSLKVKPYTAGLRGWDEAVARAKAELADAKIRVAQLKVAVKVLTEQRDAGAPWPGSDEK